MDRAIAGLGVIIMVVGAAVFFSFGWGYSIVVIGGLVLLRACGLLTEPDTVSTEEIDSQDTPAGELPVPSHPQHNAD